MPDRDDIADQSQRRRRFVRMDCQMLQMTWPAFGGSDRSRPREALRRPLDLTSGTHPFVQSKNLHRQTS